MDDQRANKGDMDREGDLPQDMEEQRFGFATADDDASVTLETHLRERPHDPAHVDLTKEEYTPDEVARIEGTSLEVVMHAIWNGELKADRKGNNVVCIKHADVVDWMRRRTAE